MNTSIELCHVINGDGFPVVVHKIVCSKAGAYFVIEHTDAHGNETSNSIPLSLEDFRYLSQMFVEAAERMWSEQHGG